MILACPSCSRQYRVDRYPPGQQVRCLCGRAMTVPEPKPHDARILHCAGCGGPLAADATSCDYCGGVLDPNVRHFTEMCPTCFARLPREARYCIECATPIRPEEVVSRQPLDRRCPRDQEPLQARGAEGVPFEECPRCAGIWLTADAFRDICQRKSTEFARNPLPDRPRGGALSQELVVYLRCPVCDQLMNRQNYGRRSGVIIDLCPEHGVWLDDRELQRIARFIAEGGLARSREIDAERAQGEARRAAAAKSSPGAFCPDETDRWGFFDWMAHLLGGR